MEVPGFFKFWRNANTGADVPSEIDELRNSSFGTDDEETDDDDSLFDLNIKSPYGDAIKGSNEDLKKNFQFIESPREVFLSKNNFSNSKFKVFLLGFKKPSKCVKAESGSDMKASPLSQQSKIRQSNRFQVKCRAEEAPVVFTRDNSLRSKLLNESSDFDRSYDVVPMDKSVSKYLKLIKPFYSKASKKAKVTDSVTPVSSPVTASVKFSPGKFSEGRRMNSFNIVSKNFGKSRSASAAVEAPPPPLRRRDDSLLDDGIRGAILHCKKSYSVSSQEFSQLSRSASDPCHEKMKTQGRSSHLQQKRCSI